MQSSSTGWAAFFVHLTLGFEVWVQSAHRGPVVTMHVASGVQGSTALAHCTLMQTPAAWGAGTVRYGAVCQDSELASPQHCARTASAIVDASVPARAL